MTKYCNSLPLRSSEFSGEQICDVQTRIDEGCSYQVTEATSLIQCLISCLSNTDCKGASLDTSNSDLCYHHNLVCSRVSGCTSPNSQHRYFARHCVGSHWNPVKDACDCDNAVYGARCDAYPRDCRGLLDNGYVDGEYWTYVDTDGDGENPIKILCHIRQHDQYHRVVIFRNAGKFDFNKTWAEYRDGFVLDPENYWVGLRAWHDISEDIRCRRAVFTVYFNLNPETTRYRRHYNFGVDDEASRYSFTYGASQTYNKGSSLSPWSEFGECLAPLENVPFSTWDSDNDGVDGENCASRNGNGWWYNGTCDNPCNALGWGYDYKDSKPSYQLMTILSARFDRHFDKVAYITLHIDDCTN